MQKRKTLPLMISLASLCIFLCLSVNCSPPPACFGDISAYTVDPQGSPCDRRCECNNQSYTGLCVEGVCQSSERESCSVEGATEPCQLPPGLVNGSCSQGVRICQPTGIAPGRWGDCKPLKQAENEKGLDVCKDGLDNDCDGKTDLADEDCENVCNPGKTEPCYTGSDPKTKNEGVCKAGIRICQSTGEWGACRDEVKPSAELCDGKDNDCNGSVDDNEECSCWPPALREPCYSPKEKDTQNIGLCKSGFRICGQDGKWGVCENEIIPDKEVCNGKDDDCDGNVDNKPGKSEKIDGCECWPPALREPCYTGTKGTQNQGVCKSGFRICGQTGKWGICENEIIPSAESCNGKDDDCDGSVDNKPGKSEKIDGCECWPPALREPCYTGAKGTQNKGVCKSGFRTCDPKGKWGICENEIISSVETCNGKDDDCDGNVDNKPGTSEKIDSCNCWPPGRTEPCYSGASGTQNVGVCAAGTRSCLPTGTWGSCQGEQLPVEEDCNLKDDDCDGKVDNIKGKADILTRACYQSLKGCIRTSDGRFSCTGHCSAGSQSCINGSWGDCVGERQPVAETCDGLDNDCDGQVDNNPTDPPICQNQKSICRNATANISRCVNGRWGACTEADYLANHKSYSRQETCDGVDNNCDGVIDEGLVGCVSIIAGHPSRSTYRNGIGNEAFFASIQGMAFDPQGNLLVSDPANYRIRSIDPCRNVTDVAGDGTRGDRNSTPLESQMINVRALARDGRGRFFFGDLSLYKVRRLDKGMQISTTAGSGTRGFQDGTRLDAKFDKIASIVSDATSNFGHRLFVGQDDGRIRVLTKMSKGTCAGVTNYTGYCTTTLVGASPTYKKGSVDGDVNVASFSNPRLAYDEANALIYVADRGTHKLRLINLKTNKVSTIAGSVKGYRDGAASAALFSQPTRVRLGPQKKYLYISDGDVKEGGGRLRRMELATKQVTTLLGGPTGGKQSGVISGFSPHLIWDFAIDADQNIVFSMINSSALYKANFNSATVHRECALSLAGTTEGYKDGPGHVAQFGFISSITHDETGNIYVSELDNHTIRLVKPDGYVSTLMGKLLPGFKDGPAQNALFHGPRGLVRDKTGALFIADTGNRRIRKVEDLLGQTCGNVAHFTGSCVTTIAGNGVRAYKDGPALSASFNTVEDLDFDSKGQLVIADSNALRVRLLKTDGTVVTIAGNGKKKLVDGPGATASFVFPRYIAVGPNDEIYVSDTSQSLRTSTVRKISYVSGGKCGSVSQYTGYCVETVIGRYGKWGFADGPGATVARLMRNGGMFVDPQGILYITDRSNNRIRVATPMTNGTCLGSKGYTGYCVTTLTGNGKDTPLDGILSVAQFPYPHDITILPQGDIVIGTALGNRIRMIPWRY